MIREVEECEALTRGAEDIAPEEVAAAAHRMLARLAVWPCPRRADDSAHVIPATSFTAFDTVLDPRFLWASHDAS